MATNVIKRLPCKISDLNLDITLNCGQSFRYRSKTHQMRNVKCQYYFYHRWKKRPSGEWIGIFSSFLWVLSQDKEAINYQVIPPKIVPTNFETSNSNREEHEDCLKGLLEDYLQLSTPDLTSLYEKWSMVDANFGKVAVDFPGVRMLRQDPVENLFCFICSSNNNIQR